MKTIVIDYHPLFRTYLFFLMEDGKTISLWDNYADAVEALTKPSDEELIFLTFLKY